MKAERAGCNCDRPGLQRRDMFIRPSAKAPEQEFEPEYVPVIVMVVRSRWAVPLAVAAQPPDIMVPMSMSIVKVMSSASMVPVKVPDIMFGIPENFIDPEMVLPLWMSCQVMLPTPL
jgi:hypothetical protein